MRIARAVIVGSLALAGCTMTADEIRDRGARETFTSSRSPAAAVECLMRNADSIRPTVAARSRPGNVAGVLEVVAQSTGGSGTLALVEISPAGAGSNIKVWTAPSYLIGDTIAATPDDFGRKLAAGC